ncbi:uncharacterized protein LOC125138519 isoform X2 [Tachysurus fulvidraco]|uniref:uncharacterized protein LOC125138519 isoform X2 n=1 Tax=Tachysurus fulvidraco TaxID=1234273 RepID=UPI001FEEC09B|nr:uncharacterized protein LOC125138519 isoform X2 [Tachysurus fulvidraco]
MINPVTLLMTFACVRELCLENNSCSPEQPAFTICIIKNCGEAVMPCVKKTIQEVVKEVKREDPSASTELLHLQAAAVLEDIQAVLHCFKKIDESLINTTFCFIDAFLGDHDTPTFMSSDTGYISCWIKETLRGFIGCFDGYDLMTLQSLQQHFAGSLENSNCFLKKFPSLSEKCIPESMQFYGKLPLGKPSLAQLLRLANSREEFGDCSTMWLDTWNECTHESWDLPGANRTLPTVAKDVYVCGIHEMIAATAKC